MNQLKIGVIISYIHRALSILITLIYTPLMVRLLGRSEYGLYNTVASVISIISLLNLGFSNTYIKYYAVYQENGNRQSIWNLNGIFFAIFSVIGIVSCLCGYYISGNLEIIFSDGLTEKEYEIARILMQLLSINLTATFVTTVFRCIITAHERFVVLKVLALVRSVASPIVTIPVLLLGYGSIGMVLATVTISLICDLIHIYYTVFVLKEKFSFNSLDLELSSDILRYTLFIAVHMIVDQINWNVDKVLLGRFRGTEEVALYSVGYNMHAYYVEIGITLTGIFTPRVHKIINQSRNNQQQMAQNLTELFTKLGRLQFMILSPIALGFIFWGKPFLNFWVGAEYSDAYYVALLLMIPGSIDIIQNIGIEIQRALDLHKFRAAVYLAMAFVNVILSIYLCQKLGAIGCAIGTAISLLVVQGVVINIYYHKKCYLNIPYFWKNIIRSSISLLLPSVFGIIATRAKINYTTIELFGYLAIFMIIYISSLYLWGLNNEERRTINMLLRKNNH